ncbi:MAG: FtsX-like permease family protein [Salinivirgaceae bacterium]
MYNLKTTIRNARKNRVVTFAKLFGLCISFAVTLFAVSYVYFETSFDKCIPGYDHIYRCLMQGKLGDENADFAVTSPAQAKAMVDEIPEITESLRVISQGQATINYQEKSFTGGQLMYADTNFFSFFSIPIYSSIASPLASENSLVIAKSVAEKYFGTADAALGKTIEMRGENCIITAVFDDVPKNFHLQVQLIQTVQKIHPDNNGWGSQSYCTYFKTNRPKINIDELNFKISKVAIGHANTDVDVANAKTMNDLKYAPDQYLFYTAEPLTDVHFSNHKFDLAQTANKTYVYGAIILAILVLLISSINFINLTIANMATRMKEIGIRKTNGAGNRNIANQFLLESVLFWLVGFVLALVVYQFSRKYMAGYLGFDIALSNGGFIKIIGYSFLALLIFNLIINIFPILIISNKRVLNLIKEVKTDNGSFFGNKSFLVLQFALSAMIILCSIVVYKQVNFLVSKNKEYDSSNVIMISMWELNTQARKSFVEELKTFGAIKSVATSEFYFGTDPSMNDAYFEKQEVINYFHTSDLRVDDAFFDTYSLELKQGRFFNKEMQSDFNTVLLNENAVKKYTSDGSLIDKKVIINSQNYNVIGIVKDFNYRSLHHQIEPLVIRRAENGGIVNIKVAINQIPEVLNILRSQWKKFNIGFPFGYQFHDDVLAQNYLKDQQAKRFLLILSMLSIAIAAVGLYSVSYFTIIRRTKEIGIRKVNGAKITEILAMLNGDFVKWVIMALIIAIPISWFAMQKWLENFAYQTSIDWWIFVMAGFIIAGIAILTVSFQSWKAATRNPVEALRYE